MFGGILKLIAFLVFLAAGIYFIDPAAIGDKILACRRPISYSLGSFDERFGLTKQEFVAAIGDAEALWEEAAGKELFAYAPQGGSVSVNLIYDYRQETTDTLEEIEEEVEQSEATYNILEGRYEALLSDYEAEAAQYENRVKVFNEKNALYKAHVDAWNKSNRTSQTEYRRLEDEREELERQFSELRRQERELNQMVEEINSLASSLNRLAESLNLDVHRYNDIGAMRGETYTGGEYYETLGERGIDIYEFSDRDKLVRVLAHELGHALGLEHVNDPVAMMYHLNESQENSLAPDDIEALKARCRLD